MSTSYIQKMERTYNSDFVGLWPLEEESGTVAYDISPNGYNATSSGLLRSNIQRSFLAPDGGKCAQFDGSSSLVNFYAAQSAQPTTEGSLSIWVATPQANLKGTTMMQIVKMGVNANNFIDLTFDATAYRFAAYYKAGGTSKSIVSPLVYNIAYGADWHNFIFTWSATNDSIQLYVDRAAQTAVSSLGTWSGNMQSNLMCLASSASDSAADQFTGWLARFAVWSAILTQSDVDDLYEIGP